MRSFDDIKIYDSVLNDEIFKTFPEHMRKQKWGIQSAEPSSKNFFWKMYLNDDDFFCKKIFGEIKLLIGDNYILDTVYFNAQGPTQTGDPHKDNDKDNAYTFLIYANLDWDIMWGGHTIFINRYWDDINKTQKYFDGYKQLETKSYMPVPNRALFFPSNIYHFAEGPTKNCGFFRFTLAYKLVRI